MSRGGRRDEGMDLVSAKDPEKRLALAAYEASKFHSLKPETRTVFGPGHPPDGTKRDISGGARLAVRLEWHMALNGYQQAISDGEL